MNAATSAAATAAISALNTVRSSGATIDIPDWIIMILVIITTIKMPSILIKIMKTPKGENHGLENVHTDAEQR